MRCQDRRRRGQVRVRSGGELKAADIPPKNTPASHDMQAQYMALATQAEAPAPSPKNLRKPLHACPGTHPHGREHHHLRPHRTVRGKSPLHVPRVSVRTFRASASPSLPPRRRRRKPSSTGVYHLDAATSTSKKNSEASALRIRRMGDGLRKNNPNRSGDLPNVAVRSGDGCSRPCG